MTLYPSCCATTCRRYGAGRAGKAAGARPVQVGEGGVGEAKGVEEKERRV